MFSTFQPAENTIRGFQLEIKRRMKKKTHKNGLFVTILCVHSTNEWTIQSKSPVNKSKRLENYLLIYAKTLR